MTDWSALVKPSLVGVLPYDPGESVSQLRARYGLDRVWKLNWNEDLFGPLDGVLDAAAAELANTWMYPEQTYADLRRAVAGWLGVSSRQVVPAHGIQALVGMVVATFVTTGQSVVIPAPTYGLYSQVCAAAGANVVRVPVRDDLGIDLEAVARAAEESRARLVWIADPNNPTGAVVTRAEWRAFLDALPPGCVAVVDEAYREYVDPAVLVARETDVARRPAGSPAAHVLEDLRARRPPARLRRCERRAGVLPRRRAGAVQRQPRRARGRAGEPARHVPRRGRVASSPWPRGSFLPVVSARPARSPSRPRPTSCSSAWGRTTSG